MRNEKWKMKNDFVSIRYTQDNQEITHFPQHHAYASIRSGGGKFSAGPVTELR